MLPLEGVERIEIAGAGYLNFYLDRAAVAFALFRARTSVLPRETKRADKILVEHTSINPNKAAHIGHLRNAVLGDTFARLLRFQEYPVEIQNYIDNTGVQVADVVVGFVHLEKKSRLDVQKLTRDSSVRFDYLCWDLYARVSQSYEENPDRLRLRSEALKAVEEGGGELAAIAQVASEAIVRAHLATMRRVNVQYDLLVQESEILRLEFWKSAFELLKEKGAMVYEQSGKNRGCWVMNLASVGEGSALPSGSEDPSGGDIARDGSASEDVKIIVRSNGTVTYVGKDIAYHLWKFGLLGKDFGYEPFDGCWHTTVSGQTNAPRFGHASAAYAVIDTRQTYLQNVVRAAFHALGYHQQASHLHHFAYEVVRLSPRCAEEMKLQLSDEDRQKGYIEVSGRRGWGVKADDLIDTLVDKAFKEVRSREMTHDPLQQKTYARMIAVAALRYFLLKYSRRVIIAFDFNDALAFEGETGPYLQYTLVRGRNILRKFEEAHPESSSRLHQCLATRLSADQEKAFFADNEDGLAFWEMTRLAAQLEMVVEQAVSTAEPAVLAKYAFRLAQSFNNFYHRYHILSEPDPSRQEFLLHLVVLVSETLNRTLDLLGIEIPERM
jgi:arginyl-tRNA synthetase